MADESSGPPSPPCNFFRRSSSSSKNLRKRPSQEEGQDKEDDDLRKEIHIKAKKRSSSPFHFESSKEIQVQHDSRATASLETETPSDRDARTLRERVLRLSSDVALHDSANNKLYRGAHAYIDYTVGFRHEHTISSEKAGGAHGPLRASAHIRASACFDYQPDICKDYNKTGYCGFGDACKFMHDRGDLQVQLAARGVRGG